LEGPRKSALIGQGELPGPTLTGSELWSWVDGVDLFTSPGRAEELRAWLTSDACAGMTGLWLGGLPFCEQDAVALAQAELPLLRELHLTNFYRNEDAELRAAGLRRLGQAPWAGQVVALSITPDRTTGCRGLGPREAAALAAGPWNNLRELNLSSNSLRNLGVQALLAAHWTSGLRRLDLNHNGIGDEGVEALANSTRLRNLADLRLDENEITDQGGLALAASPQLSNQLGLWMPQPQLSEWVRQALRERFGPTTCV
jgi:hypothetical protein